MHQKEQWLQLTERDSQPYSKPMESESPGTKPRDLDFFIFIFYFFIFYGALNWFWSTARIARHKFPDLLGIQITQGAHLTIRCQPLLPAKSCLHQTDTCPLLTCFRLWGGPAVTWQTSSRGKVPVFSLLTTITRAEKLGQLPGCSF